MLFHLPCIGLTFNRTIVELKPVLFDEPGSERRTFNRTIVELKLVKDVVAFCIFGSFNRTIVELKHEFHYNLTQAEVLLIEPLWN